MIHEFKELDISQVRRPGWAIRYPIVNPIVVVPLVQGLQLEEVFRGYMDVAEPLNCHQRLEVLFVWVRAVLSHTPKQ